MYPWTSLNRTDMNGQFIHPWGTSDKYSECEALLPGSWRSNSGQPVIPLKSIPWKTSKPAISTDKFANMFVLDTGR
jgi:hypothetical protein